MSEPTMNVLLEVHNSAARAALLTDDDASYWSEESNHIQIRNVTNVSTAKGGGIYIFRPDSDDDLVYPETEDGESRKVRPAIEVVGSAIATGDSNE